MTNRVRRRSSNLSLRSRSVLSMKRRNQISNPKRLMLAVFVVLYLTVDLLPGWESITPQQAGIDESRLQQARDYALTGGGSGCIIRSGKLVMSWGDQTTRYDLKSTSKSSRFFIGKTPFCGLYFRSDASMNSSNISKKRLWIISRLNNCILVIFPIF